MTLHFVVHDVGFVWNFSAEAQQPNVLVEPLRLNHYIFDIVLYHRPICSPQLALDGLGSFHREPTQYPRLAEGMPSLATRTGNSMSTIRTPRLRTCPRRMKYLWRHISEMRQSQRT